MSHSQDPDIRLIQQAAKGDSDAFATLFQQHFQQVYNYAMWMCKEPALAEDLTQETFIRAHRNLHRFGSPWNLRAWLYQMTRNLFIDHTRRERNVESLDPERTFSAKEPAPEQETMSRELADRVRNAIKHLPSQHREALVLRELDGFSYSDIASIMGISLDYVKVLLYRARAKFEEFYSLQLLIEDPLPKCTTLGDLLDAAYDRELLPDHERVVRAHLRDCPSCQQRRRKLIELTALLGALPPFVPPPGFGSRILEQAIEEKQTPQGEQTRKQASKETWLDRLSRHRLHWLVAAAVTAFIVLTLGFVTLAGAFFIFRAGSEWITSLTGKTPTGMEITLASTPDAQTSEAEQDLHGSTPTLIQFSTTRSPTTETKPSVTLTSTDTGAVIMEQEDSTTPTLTPLAPSPTLTTIRTTTPNLATTTSTPTALATELPETTTLSPTSTETLIPPTLIPILAATETSMPATAQPSPTTSEATPQATGTFTPTATPSSAPLSATPTLTFTKLPISPTTTTTPTETSTETKTPDTTGPKVGNITIDPNPIFTNGLTNVSAQVNDSSGVANVTLYYKKVANKGKYISAGQMTLSGDVYSITLGPIPEAGEYDLRVHAIDRLNNESCSTTNLENCSGGSLTVNIP